MAKKRINKNDIAPEGIFDNVTTGAKEAEAKIVLLTKSIKILEQTAKKVKSSGAGAGIGNTKDLRDFDALTKKANATAKAKLNIDKQLLHQKEHLARLNRQQNNDIKATIDLRKSEVGSLNRVRAENKKLAIERGKVNLKTKEGRRRIKEINTAIDRNNLILKKNASALGKQKMNIGNYGSAVGKLTGMLGKLGLGFGVFSLIRNSFNVIKDFEQGVANLRAVMSTASDKEMENMINQAKALGESTTFTASQVSALQLELGKLGFKPKQIEDMTASTLLLAEATGSELGETATVVGATLRGFGLEATETQRVVDTMAKSFTASSLDMTKFATAMSAVAPVANVAGVEIEQTTAMIGTLTDRGLDASTAGTGLRNIFLDLTKNGLTYNEAMKQINESSDKSATALDLFGKRGATLGVILAENQESVNKLTGTLDIASGKVREENFIELAEEAGLSFNEAMKEVEKASDKGARATEIFGDKYADFAVKLAKAGTTTETLTDSFEEQRNSAEKMAEVQRKTLGGALSLLQSAWEGQILKMDEAGGVADKLRKTVNFLADNLESIIKWIGIAIEAFIAFKVVMLSLKMSEKIKEFTAFNKSVKNTGETAKKASPSVKAFGKALKSIGFAVAITLLVEFAKAFWDIASGARMARMQVELFNKATTEGAEKATTLIEKNNAIIEENIRLIQRKVAEGKISQAEADKEILQEQKNAEKRNRFFIDEALKGKLRRQQARKDAEDRLKEMEAERTLLGDYFNMYQMNALNNQKIKVAKLKADEREMRVAVDMFRAEQKNIKVTVYNLTTAQIARENETKATEKNTEEKEKNTKAVKANLKAIVEAEKEISKGADKLASRLEKLNDYDDKRKKNTLEIALLTAELADDEEAILKAKIALIEEQLRVDKLASNSEIERIKLEKEAQLKIKNLKEEGAKETIKIEKQAIDFATDLFVTAIDKRIEKINEEIDAHKNRADELEELAKNGNIKAQESLAEERRLIAEDEAFKARLEKRKQRILMISSFIQSYNSNLEAGDDSGEALAKAFTSKALLEQVVDNLGSFFDGTEDTGAVSNGLDSNGGRLAVLHNNERVITAKQNAMIGSVSNEEVARVMEDRRLGKLVDGSQKNIGFENILLMQELSKVSDKLEKVNATIENKEETKIELGAITQTAMNIIETKKRKNTRTVSTFKVKA